MRILFVVDAYPDETHLWDGAFFRDQARALRLRADVAVTVGRTCSPRQWLARRGRMPYDSLRRQDGLAVYRMTGFVPTTRSDALLIRGRVRALDRAVAAFERAYGRPDVLHAHCAAFAGETAVRVGRARGIPVVITEHYSFLPALMDCYGARLLNVYERATRVVAPSRSLAERMRTLGVRREIGVMPNTVDTDTFAFEAITAPTDGEWRLLCVARDHEVKDVPTLIEVISRLRDGLRFRIEIVGPGQYARARSMAERLRLGERVRFVGELSRAALAERMRHSHLIVSSSRIETFGMTLAEALCVGRPVVATDSGGPRDIIRESDGRLVAVGDSLAMAEAIRDVLAHYGEFDLAAVASSGRQRFGPTAFANRMLGLYDEALRSVPASCGVALCN